MKKSTAVIVKIANILGLVCLFLLTAAYFAGSTMLVQQEKGKVVCTHFHIEIVDSMAVQLVLQQDIRAFLKNNRIPIVGEKMVGINLHQLEQLVGQERGIKSCEVFTHLNGVLRLRITQRSPLFRLETPKGSYYLDESGLIFPTISQRTVYVPVVSGSVPVGDVSWMAQLLDFGRYVRNHRFWNAQIEQIYVHEPNHIELIQRVGTPTTVLMGNFNRFENKLQKLYTFYRTVAPAYGWDRYECVDLRFLNQIVCRKTTNQR